MIVVGVYDGNSWLLAFTTEKRNPIIFARTETSHLPKSLQHETQIKDVTHTIYSTNKDGSLKLTTLSRIDEEESLLESNRPSVSSYFQVLFFSFGSELNRFLLAVQEKK